MMRFWLTSAFAWTLLILGLCWMPRAVVDRVGGESGFMIPNLDKLVHAGLFLGFAILWLKASQVPKRATPVLAAGLALAVLTEVGQASPLVNRDCGLDDGVFDMLGVVAGIVVYPWIFGRTAVEDRSADPRAQAKGA